MKETIEIHPLICNQLSPPVLTDLRVCSNIGNRRLGTYECKSSIVF